ncbi:MAG: monovalent cation/H+ antiporter complex subunit F [Desulfobacteraceae bacterium]|nr:monovalent cation/H+ antiporter complex subunit F [Desulfobacteraceae bacterium]
MNLWLAFAAIFIIAMLPCMILCLRGPIMERFVGFQMAQVLTVIAMLVISEGLGRDIYFDAALAVAMMSFASSLVFLRFLERWL